MSTTAVKHLPTIGSFGGIEAGGRNRGVFPELDVFYDRSALGLHPNDFVVVP